MISTSIDSGNSTDCSEDAAGGFITAIDAGVSMNCADLYISDDAADGLIATHIDTDRLITNPIDADGLIDNPTESTDCADTNVLDDNVDRLTMLMR